MERTPIERISDMIYAHELTELSLTPKENELLSMLDNLGGDFEKQIGRDMTGDEWTTLINSIPGVQEALDKYAKLTDYFEKDIENNSLRVI